MGDAVLYNDNDPRVAKWLRALIDGKHLTDGTVDKRSIVDVHAADLVGYRRVHLFAGIGGWDYALRLAEWGDSLVWTCSCPCPPFSSAGRKKRCPACGGARPIPCPRRTGHFICLECEHAWYADGRHLWPEAWRLVRDCRPPVIFGEQVASADGRIWLAGVRASLERLVYAVGTADLAAASVGAPHRRQRLFWVAESQGEGRRSDIGTIRGGETSRLREPERQDIGRAGEQTGWLGDRGTIGGVADAGQQPSREHRPGEGAGQNGTQGEVQADDQPGRRREPGGLGDAIRVRRDEPEYPGDVGGAPGAEREHGREDVREGSCGPVATGGMGHPDRQSRPERDRWPSGGIATPLGADSTGSGFWDGYDLIPCRDGKSRRVEPGSFPLAHGVPGRVGRLRGYGNAIVPQIAAEFVMAYREARIAS